MPDSIQTILSDIETYITTKTEENSISPDILGDLLSRMANYSWQAYQAPFFTDDDGNISSLDLIGVDILSIMFNGGTFIKGIQYDKAPDDPNVVFINGNSLSPNTLVFLNKKG